MLEVEVNMSVDPELFKQLRLEKNNDPKAAPFVHLQQLYEYELSAVTKYQVNSLGLYEQENLSQHWSKQGVDIYVAYKNETPIGFVVVNLSSMISNEIDTRDMAEFFVMPLERANRIGSWLAFNVFAEYPGKWEARQLPEIHKEQSKAVDKYLEKFTGGDFKEVIRDDSIWHGSIKYFESNAESAKRVEHWLIKK